MFGYDDTGGKLKEENRASMPKKYLVLLAYFIQAKLKKSQERLQRLLWQWKAKITYL